MENREFDIKADVLIAGAGPTGLMLANLLSLWDISFCLVEKKPNLSKESKAFNLHARSLEIFDQLDITEKALQKGDNDIKVHILKNGKVAATLGLNNFLPGETPHPYMLILPQDITEYLLYDSLDDQKNRVLWQHQLIEFDQTDTGIEASIIDSNEKEVKCKAKYIIGCDGAGSRVRKQAGITYEGKTHSSTFYLADAEIRWNYTHGDVYFSLAKDHITAFFPFREKNQYRIFNFLNRAVNKSEGEKLTRDDIQMIVDSNPSHNISVLKPEWTSVFKIHSRLPDFFQKRRVLLAGDAASAHSPAGGQGMNTGLQDSYNLAWKLALVLNGKAGERLLGTYHKERFKIAENLHKTTDRFFSLMTMDSFIAGLFRSKIFPSLFKFLTAIGSIRKRALRRFSQIAIHYRFSSLNTNHSTGGFKRNAPKAGDRFPYVRFMLNNQPTDTFRLLAYDRFTAIIATPEEVHDGVESLKKQLERIPVPVRTFVIPAAGGGIDFHKALGVKKEALFIIRPDGHIGLRSGSLINTSAAYYFKRLLSS